jgi:hypothetical protein
MIYVASSWRNPMHAEVCAALRASGLDHYDFKSDGGFSWTEVIPDHPRPTRAEEIPMAAYLEGLRHPRSNQGYMRDWSAMVASDTVVLVLPCGRSAHLELGWAVGRKRTAVLLTDPVVPELMYKMVDHLSPSLPDLLGWLGVVG